MGWARSLMMNKKFTKNFGELCWKAATWKTKKECKGNIKVLDLYGSKTGGVI
jgi:hypothetical protein